jgi:hypothetical protein
MFGPEFTFTNSEIIESGGARRSDFLLIKNILQAHYSGPQVHYTL